MLKLSKINSKIHNSCRILFRCFPVSIRYFLLSKWYTQSTSDYFPTHKIGRVRDDLNQRLKSGSHPSIWFLPTQTWFSTIFQRPQQMAIALAEIGCNIIYYEPWDLETWDRNQDIITKEGIEERQFNGVRDITPHLHLLRCPEYLLYDYLNACSPDALLMIWPHQAKFIPPKTSSIIIYEMIDDHDLIYNADDAWRNTHQDWVKKADIMVATADILLGQLQLVRPDTLLLPNGVRMEDWVTIKQDQIPYDMVAIRHAPIVVGYYGSISEWFDWNMWEFAAKKKPDWAFVLIGFPYPGYSEKIIEMTKRFQNVYYLGGKSFKSLANYAANIDIATIPFVINNITNAISPIKLFEYMAAGKPIVASPMQEIIKYKSVLFADSPEIFVSQLDKAKTLLNNPEYHSILKQEAEGNTWRARAEKMRNAIEAVRYHQNNIPRRKMVTKISKVK